MSETYKIKTRIGNKYDKVEKWKNVENYKPLRGEIVVYEFGDNDLQLKIGDGNKNLSQLDFYGKKILTTAPILSNRQFDYTGDIIMPFVDNTAGWVISGQTFAVNAGTYTIKCYPATGYVYFKNNQLVDCINLEWTIEKISSTIDVKFIDLYDYENVIFAGNSRTHTCVVTTNNSNSVTAEIHPVKIQEYIKVEYLSFNQIRFSLSDKARKYPLEGDELAYIKFSVDEDQNHIGYFSVVSMIVDLRLDDYSWETIYKISKEEEIRVKKYFPIGESKQITLNTIDLTGYDTYIKQQTGYVTIIGINHDGNKGIQFQWTGEQVYTEEAPVLYALTSKEYSTTINVETDRFDELGFCINPAQETGSHGRFNVTAGSWRDSYMRNHILGAKSNKEGEYEKYSFMAALPEDLRQYLKPMTVFTQNDPSVLTATATKDYITLLSEAEVLPKICGTGADSTDIDTPFTSVPNDQEQYELYKKIGCSEKLDISVETMSYEINRKRISQWLRSPYKSNPKQSFVCLSTRYPDLTADKESITGTVSHGDVTNRLSICPVFTVGPEDNKND